MTRTPCLEEMPITTEAATAVEASGAGRLSATDRSQTLRLKSQWPRPCPVFFSEVVFCLARRTGDFSLTSRAIGESGILARWNR